MSDPKWLLALALSQVLGGCLAQAPQPSSPGPTAPRPLKIHCLGKLQPAGQVLAVKGPWGSSDARIEQVLVQPGQRVVAGQLLAILDNRGPLQAQLEEASREVELLQREYELAQAPPLPSEARLPEVEAQRLDQEWQVTQDQLRLRQERLQLELDHAAQEESRYRQLLEEGAVSRQEYEAKQLLWQRCGKSLEELQAEHALSAQSYRSRIDKAELQRSLLDEVRPQELARQRARIRRAEATQESAKLRLQQASVRSPRAGTVLEILQHPGERLSQGTLLELADLSRMAVLAEVDQSDLPRVALGQAARVVCPEVPQLLLQGRVRRLTPRIQKQRVVDSDPQAKVDARVAEVHIALDPRSSQAAARWTGLQVEVELLP